MTCITYDSIVNLQVPYESLISKYDEGLVPKNSCMGQIIAILDNHGRNGIRIRCILCLLLEENSDMDQKVRKEFDEMTISTNPLYIKNIVKIGENMGWFSIENKE